jgi:hypothetical protein
VTGSTTYTTISEALEDVERAVQQLEFAIRLLTYCENGHVDPAVFGINHVSVLAQGVVIFPPRRFADAAAITTAADIGVRITFSASALVIDKAFEAAGIPRDPKANDDDSQLRTLIYMVRCAHAHAIADPRWEVREKYRRPLSIDFDGVKLALDLTDLDGRRFDIEEVGGYPGWYRILRSATRMIEQRAKHRAGSDNKDRPKPADAPKPDTQQLTREWLKAHGFRIVEPTGKGYV